MLDDSYREIDTEARPVIGVTPAIQLAPEPAAMPLPRALQLAPPSDDATVAESRLRADGLRVLAETSRTFYIPVVRLPAGLQEAVGAAYLCLRAIDEVEDHPHLEAAAKDAILGGISRALLAGGDGVDWRLLERDLAASGADLPEVTLRLGDWLQLPPASIAPRIWDATAAMADRMAYWARCGFAVHTEDDLDAYTFGVAGAVGLLLSDLWAWYDGTASNRLHAIGFGRGLQAVNILRNHAEDLGRGVDFFPDGWQAPDLQSYARRNLALADAYLGCLPPGPAAEFCRIPLALAYATLAALAGGRDKLTRLEVQHVVEEASR